MSPEPRSAAYTKLAKMRVLLHKFGTARRPKIDRLKNLLRNEAGATAIEYGLIAALIALAAITALEGLGMQLSTTFGTISTSMNASDADAG